MGNNVSVEEKVFKYAKTGDHIELGSIITQIRRQGHQPKSYLEYQDISGQTALIVASHRGYYQCVELLLTNGANAHHVTRGQERNTALHEAVSRGHVAVAELLMRHGGNPFLENGRGLTSVDIAINRQHTQMLRLLELRSDFTATLLLKIPRFMGLGAEWKDRWCVVMPRYQMTTGRAPVSRSLFVAYKDAEACTPSCKVWLDGAIARQVVGSAGAQVLQCGLSLHRNHSMAANVHMTGDASIGYTMHLRPKNGSSQAIEALRRFMDLVNGARPTPAPQTRPTQQPGTPPTPYHTAPQTPSSSAGHSQQQIMSDADLARRLQSQYDDELAAQKLPPVSLADRVSQPYGATPSPYPTIGQPGMTDPHHQHQNSAASTASFQSAATAPLYPNIDMTSAGATSSPNGTGMPGESGNPFGASPEWFRNNAAQATAPPASASQPAEGMQGEPSKQSSATHRQTSIEDEEAGQCVICLAAPATAGFLHGESVHKCCCKECAQDLKKAHVPTCPMCRQPIEHVIFNFY